MHSDRLVSVLGLLVLLILCWLLSNNRKRFPWRATLTGLGMMFAFAILILKTSFGLGAFRVAQNAVDQLNVYAVEGARLIFGPLGDPVSLGKTFGPNSYVFAISISATIIVVGALAWIMQRAMKASGSESLAASSNIFLGQTEAALVIKPYLAKLTMSEMNVLMVTGFSTIATGVMVVYAGLPGMTAGDIVTASVLSSISGLFVAKIMFPETEVSETGERCHFGTERSAVNSVDALCQGAAEGTHIVAEYHGDAPRIYRRRRARQRTHCLAAECIGTRLTAEFSTNPRLDQHAIRVADGRPVERLQSHRTSPWRTHRAQ